MVQLVIRSISGGVKDLPLQFEDDNTTVLKVKQSISEQYPGNPPPSTQKLIFAGRLLQEETTLAEILKLYDKTTTQIFYLKISSTPAPQQAPQQQHQQQSTNANIPQPNVNYQGFNPGYPAPQFYAQFRMGVVPPNQPYANFPNMNNPYMRRPPQFYGANQPNNGWQPQQPNFNGNPMFPQQPQPPRPANDGERTNQFYLLLKMVFLVYILSQGGSTTRTLVLGVGALIAFLYQTGRLQIFSLGPNQGQAQQPRNQPNANNPQPQQQQQGVNNDPAQQNPNNQAQQQVPAQTGIVGAVMPFFYSLLPSWNPGVQPALVPPAPNRGVDN